MTRAITRQTLVLIFLSEIAGIFISKYFSFFRFLAGDVCSASIILIISIIGCWFGFVKFLTE